MSLLLAETTENFWRPGIGDPTFMGWFTVVAYLMAAVLCWRAHRAATGLPGPELKTAARFWMLLTILFAVLAVNKQLDLQSLFTAIGRWAARRGGWYDERHRVQMIFVAALAVAGLVAIAWLLWLTRRGWRRYGLAVAGATFIVFFVVIRAASFHHVDVMLSWNVLGFYMNWALELGGIACVAISAARNGRPKTAVVEARRVPFTAGPASQEKQRESFRWMVQRINGRSARR